jgi:TPR repeat protein
MKKIKPSVIELHNKAASYGLGEGVKRNVSRSRSLYRQAWREGSVHAAYELAMSYLLDRPKSIAHGFKWLRRAAHRGESGAQELLGDIYAKGNFSKRANKAIAAYWYAKAVASGSRRARRSLKALKAVSNRK